MDKNFDLDVSFEEHDPDLSALSEAQLKTEIAKLPESIGKVAYGLLIEKRTMSDVSQALGIRQAELVTRLHRAKLTIASNLGL
mgnify:FL=1